MAEIESFYIEFDNPLATYYSGQTLTGKVILKLNEELNFKGISLQIEGKAKVRWREKASRGLTKRSKNKSRLVIRSDSHSYFDYEIILVELGSGEERKTLKAGQHEYVFSQILPSSLPSSFEGTYGHIRYICSASISIPWRFDPKCKTAFTILEIVDLNTLPGINLPCSGNNSKTLGMLCFQSGFISASMTLERQGYVPGENINIKGEVENSSDDSVTQTTATLLSMIAYRADEYTRLERKNIVSVNHGMVQPRRKDQIIDLSIAIPSIHPTRVGAALCRLINIEYFVEFKANPAAFLSKDLEFTIPLTIGSVPLVNNFNEFKKSEQLPVKGTVGCRPSVFKDYPNLPNVSYKECTGEKINITEEDDEHVIGNVSYKPRYHYFSNS